MGTKHIPVEDLPLIIAAVQTRSMESVCKQWGCGEKGIRDYLSRHYKCLRVIKHEYLVERIKELLAKGLSQEEVQKKLGISNYRVRNVFTDLYIPRSIPEEDLDKVVDLLKYNHVNAVAAMYNVNRGTVSRFIESRGYSLKQILVDHRSKVIIDSLVRGLSMTDTAKELRVTTQYAYTLRRKLSL